MNEEEEKPFKAEYAKSGRAGCKQCHGTISKDTLRLAKMVQSAHFDGKQPNWYHFACFFKRSIIHSTSQVSGFGSLRWEDQEKIRKKMEGAGTDSTDGPAPAKKSKRVTTRSDLTVEYAKSNRSTCKGCNSQIDKDEIRIAKMVEPEPDKKFAALIPNWHHVDCFLDNLSSLEAVGVSPEELSGFTKLKKEGKDEVKQKFIAKVGQVKKKGKKSSAASEEALPPPKKPKVETKEEKILKEQSKLVWKLRDELRNNLSKTEMHQLLQANSQDIPKGEDNILKRLSDGMAFGALKRCPQCEVGQLTLRSHCYQCTGNLTAWAKCTYTTTDPNRDPWVVPQDLMDIPFLKTYKFKSGVRAFDKEATPPGSLDVVDGPGTSQSLSSGAGGSSGGKVEAPLKGFRVYIVGRLSKTKPVLTQQIEDLGGRVVSSVSENTTICLSNDKELEKMSKKMEEVKECDVPVVGEEFLEEAGKGAALLKIPGSTISEWGAPRHSLPADAAVDGGKSFKSFGPSKVKVTVKGAAAVDPESELDHSHHVLEEGKTIWNAVLGLVDMVRGTNSYYKLQLLEGDKSKSYYIFRSWGRVGTTIGSTKTESFGASKASAKQSFETLFAEKTGNQWGTKNFVKCPGKFYPLDIDYGQEESSVASLGASAGSSSKLAPQIQDLIRLIFDVESMKKAMLEFEIDMKKMPLGKLSRRQMQEAYSVLSELQREISSTKNPAKILDASTRFYTLIPHDFGMKKPPLLDTEDIIKVKTQMVDNLLEIEVAYSLLKQESDGKGAKDPLDVHYEQLKTDMEVLPQDTEEFQRLVTYVANTHAATHNQYELEVLEVFKVARHGEDGRFQAFSKLHNRQLLWHGSRTTNFCGILSQGLRIAPPEAPVTGYMFGKGVYFADMVSKSANYCRTSKADNVGLLLLCEVALGDMYELKNAKFIEKLPKGKHSTKGLGRTAPDPTSTYVTPEGVAIPMGKGMNAQVSNTSLLYNEFIVYDVSQIKMHYLIKMNFKYRW